MSRIGLQTYTSMIATRDASILICKRYNRERYGIITTSSAKYNQIYAYVYKGESNLIITPSHYRYNHNNVIIKLYINILQTDIIVESEKYTYAYTDYEHTAKVSKTHPGLIRRQLAYRPELEEVWADLNLVFQYIGGLQ